MAVLVLLILPACILVMVIIFRAHARPLRNKYAVSAAPEKKAAANGMGLLLIMQGPDRPWRVVLMHDVYLLTLLSMSRHHTSCAA